MQTSGSSLDCYAEAATAKAERAVNSFEYIFVVRFVFEIIYKSSDSGLV